MNQIRLFPYAVRNIGFALTLLSGIIALAFYLLGITMHPPLLWVLKTTSLVGLILALQSKEKLEEERLVLLRWRAALIALPMPAVIIMATGWSVTPEPSRRNEFLIAFMVLFVYHIVFQLSKRL